MPAPTVRRATAADAAELVRLGALMFESMGIEGGDPGWRERALAVAGEGLAGGAFVAFVADDPARPGRLAASAAGSVAQRLPGPMNPTGRVGYVQYVSTDAGHRRRGLARAAMEALLAWYGDQGVGRVELHATADGEPMYRALGFAEGDNVALRRLGPATRPRPAASRSG